MSKYLTVMHTNDGSVISSFCLSNVRSSNEAMLKHGEKYQRDSEMWHSFVCDLTPHGFIPTRWLDCSIPVAKVETYIHKNEPWRSFYVAEFERDEEVDIYNRIIIVSNAYVKAPVYVKLSAHVSVTKSIQTVIDELKRHRFWSNVRLDAFYASVYNIKTDEEIYGPWSYGHPSDIEPTWEYSGDYRTWSTFKGVYVGRITKGRTKTRNNVWTLFCDNFT